MRGARTAEQNPSVGEWAQTLLLAANLIWTTLCLGGFRPGTMLVTLSLNGLLLLVHFATCAAEGRCVRTTDPAGWLFLPFLGYAVINVWVITPVRWLGWLDLVAWANMVAVVWVVSNGIRSLQTRRALFHTLVLLGGATVLIAAYQRFIDAGWLMLGRQQAEQFLGRSSGSFGIPNSLAGFLLLLLPATGALAFRPGATATERVWWGWLTVVLGFGLLLTVSRGGWIALAIALSMWPICARGLKWQRRVLIAAGVLMVLMAAGAVLYQSAPKSRERFDDLVRDTGELSRPVLWRSAWENFREHPLVGSGAGSFNVMFEQHRPDRFVDAPQWAHNEYLNTLSDYGALGFLFLFGAGTVMAIRGRRRHRDSVSVRVDWPASNAGREGLAIGVLAFALQAFVDFHFKVPALAMAFSVVAALAFTGRTPMLKASGPRERFPRGGAGSRVDAGSRAQPNPTQPAAATGTTRFAWLLATAGVALLLFPVLRFYRAESLRYEVRQAIDAADLNRKGDLSPLLLRAEQKLQQATTLATRHAGAWADLAFALQLRAFAEPALVASLAEPAVEAAKRAIGLSAVVPEFWIRLGVALDMQARREEAERALLRAVELAPRNSHGWYYYAAHLSFDTNRRDAALRAIATCLSLDPGNGAAEALRAKLNEHASVAPFIP